MTVSGRILVAEDQPANAQLFTAVLTRAGYQVVVAPDGVAAAEIATQSTFDLILMDLGLPRIDGFQATARIREAGGDAPIVALTAETDHAVELACADAGMAGFLSKPVSPPALLERVAHFMAQTAPA